MAHRIVRYANIMGRENMIAGTDCGYGNRVYPDIAWAKMRHGGRCSTGHPATLVPFTLGTNYRVVTGGTSLM